MFLEINPSQKTRTPLPPFCEVVPVKEARKERGRDGSCVSGKRTRCLKLATCKGANCGTSVHSFTWEGEGACRERGRGEGDGQQAPRWAGARGGLGPRMPGQDLSRARTLNQPSPRAPWPCRSSFLYRISISFNMKHSLFVFLNTFIHVFVHPNRHLEPKIFQKQC